MSVFPYRVLNNWLIPSEIGDERMTSVHGFNAQSTVSVISGGKTIIHQITSQSLCTVPNISQSVFAWRGFGEKEVEWMNRNFSFVTVHMASMKMRPTCFGIIIVLFCLSEVFAWRRVHVLWSLVVVATRAAGLVKSWILSHCNIASLRCLQPPRLSLRISPARLGDRN